MSRFTIAVLALGVCNQVDGRQDVGIFESEPRAAQGFNPHTCFADSAFGDVAWIMKKTYADGPSAEIAMREHPTYYEMPKEQGMTGEDFRYAVKTGNPQAISGTYTDAAAGANGNSGVIKGEQFAAEPGVGPDALLEAGNNHHRPFTSGCAGRRPSGWCCAAAWARPSAVRRATRLQPTWSR